ncbi:MAG: SIMPL domain-containing protein, partial [Clostridia bacterium]|nr:SIMPL domain-containing protein [Clostridia bacterium]
MHRRIGLVFVLVSVLLALWAVPALAAGPDPTGESNIPRGNKITLSVSGKGTVAAAPSTAQITFAVQTTGKTAQEAQRENARILDRVFTELLAFGIDKQDIRTMNYNVWPDYNWKKQEEGQ